MHSDKKALKIVSTISKLPSFSPVAEKIIAVLSNSNVSSLKAAEAVSSDSVIATKVLKLANSSFYGFSGTVTTISRAVVLLGFSAVRSIAISQAVFDAISAYQDKKHAYHFWTHAMNCAASSFVVAKKVGYQKPEEAFIAGLLHDIGYLVLSVTFPKDFTGFIDSGLVGNFKEEENIFGIDHSTVGSQLLSQWSLPNYLPRICNLHHTYGLASFADDKILTSVMMSDIISKINGSVFNNQIQEDFFWKSLREAGLSPNSFREMLFDVERKINAATTIMRFHTSGNSDMDFEENTSNVNLPGLYIMLISHDEKRLQWLNMTLNRFGCKTYISRKFSDIITNQKDYNLLMIDLEDMDDLEYSELKQYAVKTDTMVITVDNQRNRIRETLIEQSAPLLPVIFSKTELEKLLAMHFRSLIKDTGIPTLTSCTT
jgi:HD-like signal output (HDOD) protein